MSKYEQTLDRIDNDKDILVGKAQIQYINELEALCKTCDRIILHSVIARTAFSHRRFLEKFAARRGFAISFIVEDDSFILERIADSKNDQTVKQIIQKHKEDVCQKEKKNREGMSKLR